MKSFMTANEAITNSNNNRDKIVKMLGDSTCPLQYCEYHLENVE